MCNETDKINAAKQEAARYRDTSNMVGRERTVAELLDHKIDAADAAVRVLRDLKASLPGSFLASGASRLPPFTGF